ncbi:leucine zipper putative tumor suppressor 1 [Trichomycterus rosablanca]|uniref:leucine zipper putative tumor suppressor 1 n=1 Tax=Trichomycterus rosablanca TaxID=2290929 RepID=UPI002F360929
MGSVSSLITSSKSCRISDHKLKKRGLMKHGFTNESAINSDSKLSHVSGNTDDFFYIKVSHKPRSGEEGSEELGLRRTTPTELNLSARSDQTAERSLTPGFPRCSSSTVETHNSLRTILGSRLSPVERSKVATPEPKLEMSTGSPSDSGISGSSWISDGVTTGNRWTGAVNGEDRGSNPSTRSASVLSDLIHGQHGARTGADRSSRIRDRRSPFSDLSSGSMDELVMERKPEGPESDLQLHNKEVSQHALHAQQLLQMQVVQLQEEKERLKEEMDRLVRERDSAQRERSFSNQHTQLTPTLEETQWEVCQKAGEISLLKQQLKDSQADVVNKLSEIVALKSALRDARSKLKELEEKNRGNEEALKSRRTEMEVCENELQRKKNEAELLREKVLKLESDMKGLRRDLAAAREDCLELSILKIKLQEQQDQLQIYRSEAAEREASGKKVDADVDTLREEVAKLREELEEEREKKEKILESFRHEKQTWNKEKEKVIRYQKQLQFNYLQTRRKNQDLERTLREPNLKMGIRTMDTDVDVQKADDGDFCDSLFSVTD